jgi:hypothetical protein
MEVYPTVCLALNELNSEVELLESDCPLVLMRSIGTNSLDVLKVLIVHAYFDLMLCTL